MAPMNTDKHRSVQVNVGVDRRMSEVDTGSPRSGSYVTLFVESGARILSDRLPASLKDGRERAAFLLLASCVATVLVSIAISQILLAATLAAVLWLRSRGDHLIPAWPSYGWPLLLFFTWTLLAALAGPEPLRDLA